MNSREGAKLADSISDQIRPLLAGAPPEIQGAVIGDMMAIFLAGHRGPDAEKVREYLLERHVELVRDLVGHYDAEIQRAASGNGGVA